MDHCKRMRDDHSQANSELAQLEFNHEWYRNSPWSSWDPTKLADDQLEKIAMKIVAQTRSSDA